MDVCLKKFLKNEIRKNEVRMQICDPVTEILYFEAQNEAYNKVLSFSPKDEKTRSVS